MHDQQAHELMELVFAFTRERMEMDPPPLDQPVPFAELEAAAGQTITPQGLGAPEVMRLFEEVLGPACLSIDHPRYLSFIPAAPTEAATLFDLVVSATSIYGGSWMEGSGAVYAENQTLRWLADLAGLPPEAGGTFVSGGSIANLSALAVARTAWRDADPSRAERRPIVVRRDLEGVVLLQLGLSLSLFTVVLGHVLVCLPYSVTVLSSGFEGFDRSLEEASADLGESAYGTFTRVTLPLVSPAIISSLLVSFTISLDEFIMAFFLTGTESTLPVYIWGQLRFAAKLPSVLALGTLLLVGSFLLLSAAEILRRRVARRVQVEGAVIV
mgnify:CR=1 FL=1